jgi:hypothetical protein
MSFTSPSSGQNALVQLNWYKFRPPERQQGRSWEPCLISFEKSRFFEKIDVFSNMAIQSGRPLRHSGLRL